MSCDQINSNQAGINKFLNFRIYQDKLANLKKQLEEVANGTHPELLRRYKQLEREYNDRLRLNVSYRDYLLECVDKDYIYEKNAAAKEYEEKKADLRDNLLADFDDKKKMIEAERVTLEIIESSELRQTITRKLRRRPNDPVPVTEKRRKPGSGPGLVLALDDKDIEYDLRMILKGKPMVSNARNYSQNSMMMANSSNSVHMSYHNDTNNADSSRVVSIENGKLLFERRWFCRGQGIYVEGTDVSKFPASISAIVGNDVVMVKRLSDNSKFRIYTHQLSSGKISIKRRAN